LPDIVFGASIAVYVVLFTRGKLVVLLGILMSFNVEVLKKDAWALRGSCLYFHVQIHVVVHGVVRTHSGCLLEVRYVGDDSAVVTIAFDGCVVSKGWVVGEVVTDEDGCR